jgi:hypothetical protein
MLTLRDKGADCGLGGSDVQRAAAERRPPGDLRGLLAHQGQPPPDQRQRWLA